MTFGWGILIGVLGTISTEAVLLVIGAIIVQRKKNEMFKGLKRGE